MKTAPGEEKKKPVLSVMSLLCIILCVPAARYASDQFAPGEDLLGYGGLAVALMVIVGFLAMGFVFGVGGLLRAEKPRLLAIFGTAVCAVALIWVMANKPG